MAIPHHGATYSSSQAPSQRARILKLWIQWGKNVLHKQPKPDNITALRTIFQQLIAIEQALLKSHRAATTILLLYHLIEAVFWMYSYKKVR